MELFKVSFKAENQQLTKLDCIKHASDTYEDIEATFILGEKWTDMDSVSAVWWNDYNVKIATVLDSEGKCIVPHEVLTRKGCVRVNLVGSVVENDELVTRLTSYSAEAVQINEKIRLTGSETSEITPSEYEQFVANVKADADRAETAKEGAREYAESAQASATASASSAMDSSASATASANSASQAQTSAQNADISAQSAETAKDEAESARDKILGMRATAETLEPNQSATASYSNGLLTLGIPKGQKGDTGEKGDKGETGATPSFTIGNVDTLEPNESATATITGTAENPVLNLGIPQGRNGEVTYEDLESILPRDTASGQIASFPDGQSVIPLHSLKVSLEPIQEGTPWQDNNVYTEPYLFKASPQLSEDYNAEDNAIVGGTVAWNQLVGSGAMSVTVQSGHKYYANVNSIASIGQSNGTAITINDSTKDNVIDLTQMFGSTIADYIYNLEQTTAGAGVAWFKKLFPKDYYEYDSGTLKSVEGLSAHVMKDANGNVIGNYPLDNSLTLRGIPKLDASNNLYYDGDEYASDGSVTRKYGVVDLGTLNWTRNKYASGYYYFRCEFPSIAYGKSGANVNVVCSPYTTVRVGTISLSIDKTITTYYTSSLILIRDDSYTDATAFKTAMSGVMLVYELATPTTETAEAYTNPQSVEPYGTEEYVTTSIVPVGHKTRYMRIAPISGYTEVDTFVSPTTSETDATKYTTQLGQTVYGGTLDVVSGELVIDKGYIASYNGETLPSTWISDRDVYASGTTPTIGAKVVYELATPQTIQLTPQEVRALLGQNNVWSDGDVVVVYSADTALWIEKKLNT